MVTYHCLISQLKHGFHAIYKYSQAKPKMLTPTEAHTDSEAKTNPTYTRKSHVVDSHHGLCLFK